MKKFKLFSLALFLIVLMAASNTFSQWTYVPGSINMSGLGDFPFICTLDENTAWVCGGAGGAPKVYRTTNGGMNFVNVTGPLTGPEFYAIWVVDQNTCIVGDGGAVGGAGGIARLWRTTDAGVTWTNVFSTAGGVAFFNGICGLQSNRSWMFAESDQPSSGGQVMCISTNGGANWTFTQTTVSGNVGAAGSVWASSTQIYGNGMSSTPRSCFTTNGGTSWNQGTFSVAGTFSSGFTMSDNGQIHLGATNSSLPNISRSVNTGASYTNVSVGAGATGLCVIKWIPGTNAAYLSGKVGTNAMRRSVDGGATWTTMTTGGITGFNDLSFVFIGGVVYGYAIAEDGSVVKLVDNTLTAIDPNNTNTPETFALQQNYPNPFNPVTTIKYSVPVSGNVSVKIYNSMGAEVMTVVNKNHSSGNYVEEVDMSQFSSGIYFYTMTSGGFTETKKMMLVK
jgi:hypothetical protein